MNIVDIIPGVGPDTMRGRPPSGVTLIEWLQAQGWKREEATDEQGRAVTRLTPPWQLPPDPPTQASMVLDDLKARIDPALRVDRLRW